jgi:ABC-type transporter Mla subunit MlaD
MMDEKTRVISSDIIAWFRAGFVLLLILGLAAGVGFWLGRCTATDAGRGSDTVSRELERTRQQLDAARGELETARVSIERLEAGIRDSERLVDNAQGAIGNADGIGGELKTTVDANRGAVTTIRSILGLGDGGRGGDGAGEHPP